MVFPPSCYGTRKQSKKIQTYSGRHMTSAESSVTTIFTTPHCQCVMEKGSSLINVHQKAYEISGPSYSLANLFLTLWVNYSAQKLLLSSQINSYPIINCFFFFPFFSILQSNQESHHTDGSFYKAVAVLTSPLHACDGKDTDEEKPTVITTAPVLPKS